MSDGKEGKGLAWWGLRRFFFRWIGLPLSGIFAILILPQADRAAACIGVDGTVPPEGGSKPNDYMVRKINLAHQIAKLNGLQAPASAPVVGNHKTVIILIEDSTDGAAFRAEYRPAALWHDRLDQFDTYFNEVSRGLMRIVPASESHGTVNDGVIGPVRVANLSSTTNIGGPASSSPYSVAAIRAANPYINFASFDTNADGKITSDELHILVYQAGDETYYGYWHTPCARAHFNYSNSGFTGAVPATDSDSKIITSYGYCGSEFAGYWMATMGPMIHLIGHDLGLPDLLDTDGTRSGGLCSGVGAHSMMGNGYWGYVPGAIAGSTPNHIDAYYKNWLGWETQTVVTVPGNASYTLLAANGNNQSLRVNIPTSNEFFIIENRQQTGYDAGLPGSLSGLIVYHCDGTLLRAGVGINDNPNNLGMAVEQASGSASLRDGTNQGADSDYFRAESNFNAVTTPNSKLKNGTASGVAMGRVSAPGTLMTFNLGTAPPTVGTFRINNGAASTGSRSVTLNNTGLGSLAPSHYMASESSSFSGASWLAYSAAPSFTLSSGNGTKTVYFKIKTARGLISPSKSDSILLDEIYTLRINDLWRDFTISPSGEADWFQFTVTTAGVQAIETQAGTLTDNYLWLYGPSNRSTRISQDNDSGPGAMARIVRNLAHGTYYVKCMANVAKATGTYRIRVISIPPPAITSFAINNKAPFTGTRSVILSYTATGNPTHYIASELAAFAGVVWQPIPKGPIPFTLSAVDGVKTVYLRLMGEGGMSAVASDKITLKSVTLEALLIYKTGATDINAYATLLKSRGINCTVLKRVDLTGKVNLAKYHVLILGHESGDAAGWGTATQRDLLKNGRKPIVGIGQGGGLYFDGIGLRIGWLDGRVSNKATLSVLDGNHTVYRLPRDLGVASGGSISVFGASNELGLLLNPVPSGVIALGRESGDQTHYPLAFEGINMLWGYHAGPTALTAAGANLFENVVRYTASLGAW